MQYASSIVQTRRWNENASNLTKKLSSIIIQYRNNSNLTVPKIHVIPVSVTNASMKRPRQPKVDVKIASNVTYNTMTSFEVKRSTVNVTRPQNAHKRNPK